MTTDALPAERSRFELVPLSSIRFLPQVRDELDVTKKASMKRSLVTGGLVQPVVLRPMEAGLFTPVDGHYRVAAAMELGWDHIPAVIDGTKRTEADVMGAQLATAECRFELNPMERARGYDNYLRASQVTAAQLAALIGSSEAQVSKTRALIGIRDDLQQLVATGKLAPSVALELNHVTDPGQYELFLQRARAGELTRLELQVARKPHKHRRRAQPAKRPRRITVKLRHGCCLTLPTGACSPIELASLLGELAEQVRQVSSATVDAASLFVDAERA